MAESGVPNILWFIPSGGDRRYLGSSRGSRKASFQHFETIARAADALGFDGVLIPTGQGCQDAWVLASALASVTERLRFLVAVRPGVISPTYAARAVATLDHISGGRAMVNIVAGGNPQELAGDGIHLDHAQRYSLTDEWLTIFRRVLAGEVVDFTGKHLQVKGAQRNFAPLQQPYPPIYFGGSSAAGIGVAGQHSDVYLTWGEPPELVAEKIRAVKRQAVLAGRTVRFGIRLHVIVRETEEEAWAVADRLIQDADEQLIATARERLASGESVGQQRMLALHGNGTDRESLKIGPHLWAGIGLLRGGAGTALVGNPEQVAEAMREYQALGIDTFVLSGYPHLEEAYYVAELLFPRLGKVSGLFEERPVLEDLVLSAGGRPR